MSGEGTFRGIAAENEATEVLADRHYLEAEQMNLGDKRWTRLGAIGSSMSYSNRSCNLELYYTLYGYQKGERGVLVCARTRIVTI